jgi:tetratricopeptide (TPR) repeat protein
MQAILSNNKKTYFLFFALCLLFYGNSLKNGFSFDDSYVTVTNTPVKGQKFTPNNELIAAGIKGIPKIWQSRYGHGNGTSYDYRPVVMTLFAIEYSIFGSAPHLNHFVNIVLYSLIVFFLFLLLKVSLKKYPFNELFALVSAVLFLAHPLHSEVVNNIKCADELLAMLFGLLAVFYTIKFFETKQVKQIAFGAFFIFLALYSKLTAALFIILIPLVLFLFFNVSKKHIIFLLLGLWACFILYNRSKGLIVTEKEVRYYFHFENPLYTEQISFFTKILFALKSLGIYIKLLFFPYPLRFYYGTDMIPTTLSLFDFEVILAVVFVAAAVLFCIKTKNKIAIFGLLFFLISIAPIINFREPIAGIIGERLCLIASTGFVIFIVAVLFSFYKTVPVKTTLQLFSKKPLVYLSVVLFIFLCYTWNRTSYWKDEITLFEHDVPYLENSAGANNLLANKYFDMLYSRNSKYSQKELVEKCKQHYSLAIKADSSVYSAFNNLGVVYFSFTGDYQSALGYFLRAVNAHKDYPQALENVGNAYERLGNYEAAIKYFRMAISQNVKQQKAYLQMMRVLLRLKRFKEAEKFFGVTDKVFENDYSFTIEKGNYYFMLEKYDSAAPKFLQAYQSKKTKELAYALYMTYAKLNDTERSSYFKKENDSFVNNSR